jgi:hypothetical protein
MVPPAVITTTEAIAMPTIAPIDKLIIILYKEFIFSSYYGSFYYGSSYFVYF